MDFDKIVERQLWLVDSKINRKIDLQIEIGRPQWTIPETEARCSVYIRGLMIEPIDIFGSDLLNALECSLNFIENELKNHSKDWSVQWPGGELYFN